MARRQRQTENNIPEQEPKSATELNPVTLWFRPVKDTATDATVFIDAHLMLEDAELGVMPPNMYFFAAENSKRAEELNFIAIDRIAYALDAAKTEWNAEPTFSLTVTTRFLESDETFNAFLAKLESMEISRKRIILTFSALTVLHLGRRVNTYLRRLREEGYTVALTDYAVDTAHFSLLFDYTFDILRIDADYLADSYQYSRKKSAVEVLVAFAEKENIKLIANGVGDMTMKSVMSELGLTVMCGRAVARGTDKLDRALGIEIEKQTAETTEEEQEHPFETVEAEAPAARASASEKIKNKTAVLEKEVEELENAPEPTEPEEQPEVEESTEDEEPVEEEPTEVEEPAEVEEQIEVVETAEVEEPTEPETEEQKEVIETAEAEEQSEPEAEEQIEVVEETAAEEPTNIDEISTTASESEAISPERSDDIPTSESEVIYPSQSDDIPADEVRDENGEVRDENAALAEFLLSAGIDFLSEEDIALVLYGGLDALDEEKRNKVIEALENLG